MNLYEIKLEKHEENGEITYIQEYVIGFDFEIVYQRTKKQLEGLPNHELGAIIKHVPIVEVFS